MPMTKKQLEKMSRIYHMMSDPSRLKIVLCLSKNETNVTALCKKLHMSQPTVSRHLSLLKLTGIAEARRNGKEIYYSILPESRKTLNVIIAKGMELI
ncbi:MAG TPA: metalloregulator ArsR/SmtB family transcription factor [Phycisphaerae bacterium]|nr:metalloregulator ArsR/SmtB family transcription factor [Phycisphaerae bacterium]HPS53933.1 metalloregulator ArsR/SmtB family transcription factor [Phycisphaerae bacterium]